MAIRESVESDDACDKVVLEHKQLLDVSQNQVSFQRVPDILGANCMPHKLEATMLESHLKPP